MHNFHLFDAFSPIFFILTDLAVLLIVILSGRLQLFIDANCSAKCIENGNKSSFTPEFSLLKCRNRESLTEKCMHDIITHYFIML